jgi:hypothetical protein
LPSVCLCGHSYCKASYMFGFEIWATHSVSKI